MTGLLEGVKILDMGQVVAVPAAGGMLADWGAEVVKVEPLTGDTLRGVRMNVGVDAQPESDNSSIDWHMQLFNKNKKSIALDLKQDAGREIVYKLVKKYDIFMTNYEMQSITKLKMDYATLSNHNPSLIYGLLSAYGTVGPDKDERGYDYGAAWARGGIQNLIGEPDSIPPAQRGGMMDRLVGGFIAAGILAAMFHREKTGKGQEIEFTLYHTGVWAVAGDIQNALKGMPVKSNNRVQPPNPLSNCYYSKDGRWFRLSLLHSDEYWPTLLRVFNLPELKDDPRFTTMDLRAKNASELVPLLDKVFGSINMAELEKLFRANGLAYGKVQTPTEIINDPQAILNGIFEEKNVPGDGKVKIVTPPIRFKQNPGTFRTFAPELGQNTEELLLDLGYGWEDIAGLKERRVVL